VGLRILQQQPAGIHNRIWQQLSPVRFFLDLLSESRVQEKVHLTRPPASKSFAGGFLFEKNENKKSKGLTWGT